MTTTILPSGPHGTLSRRVLDVTVAIGLLWFASIANIPRRWRAGHDLGHAGRGSRKPRDRAVTQYPREASSQTGGTASVRGRDGYDIRRDGDEAKRYLEKTVQAAIEEVRQWGRATDT